MLVVTICCKYSNDTFFFLFIFKIVVNMYVYIYIYIYIIRIHLKSFRKWTLFCFKSFKFNVLQIIVNIILSNTNTKNPPLPQFFQDDTYTESYISTIGVDFVSIFFFIVFIVTAIWLKKVFARENQG